MFFSLIFQTTPLIPSSAERDVPLTQESPPQESEPQESPPQADYCQVTNNPPAADCNLFGQRTIRINFEC